MSFQEFILSTFLSAAFSSALVGIVFWILREWISAHIKGSIQHEYDQKLEAHKAKLKAENEVSFFELKTKVEHEAALYTAAHASFSEGQKATIERKLKAVDRIWDQVVHLRVSLPPVFTFMDILTIDEYENIKDHPTFQALSGELSPEKVAGMVDQTIEVVRPYVGEYMWAVFYSYQSIMIRILILLHFGLNDASKIEWYKDHYTRAFIEATLTKQELDEFDAADFGKISLLQRLLEHKILNASSKVISGERFGEEAIKQAMVIEQQAVQLQSVNQKSLLSKNI